MVCIVPHCHNRADYGYRMINCPRDPSRRKEWEHRINRPGWRAKNSSQICQVHFASDCFYVVKPGMTRLTKTALPTIFPHGASRSLNHGSMPQIQREHSYVKVRNDAPTIHQDVPMEGSEEVLEEFGDELVDDPEIIQVNMEKPTVLPELDVAINEYVETSCYCCTVKAKIIRHLKSQICKLKHKLCVEKRERSKEKKELLVRREEGSFFGMDQLMFLKKKTMKGHSWTTATIRDALKIRFSGGSSGYECLRGLGYPLPAIRTLQHRTESILFNPGILHEVFDLLELKTKQMSHRELLCSLVLDEMTITPGMQWDCKSDSFIGGVSLGPEVDKSSGSSIKGSKCLVFMLAGLGIRWKQIVAYDFTPPSLSGSHLVPRMKEVMSKAYQIGIKVISVTTDMAGSNQSMWA